MTIEELAQILNGIYKGCQGTSMLDIRGAVVDSRKAFEGALFFCIRGCVVDGHDYIDSAYSQGAILAIVERDVVSPIPYILVESVIEALGKLAHYKRSLYSHVVIAITGSSGKTTAKEILTHVLEAKGPVSKNLLNQNNQIGMPLSILNAQMDAIAWVLELGISEANDMSQLGAIAEPNIVYITNAGNAHMQGLGDKGVAYHKASLLAYIPQSPSTFLGQIVIQQVFISSTAQSLIGEVERYNVPVCYVDTHNPVSVEYQGIEPISTYGIFCISYESNNIRISIPYRGHFMQDTLCSVINIALYLGMDFSSICQRLSTLSSIRHRNSVIRHKDIYIIDDTYNANPISMQAMIESAYSYPAKHYILVLGDMKELDTLTEQEHHFLGAYIASKSINTKTSVLWKGIYADYVQQGLYSSGFQGNFYVNPSRHILARVLEETLQGVILCKGSRSLALEEELKEIYSLLGVGNCDI